MTEVMIDDSYTPSENETFMNERQIEYFRRRLHMWKQDLMGEARDTLEILQNKTEKLSDITDQATIESHLAVELSNRDRQLKLARKIDIALSRIEEGSYGYCEATGEPISLKRLVARPIATLSLEAQERYERCKRIYPHTYHEMRLPEYAEST